MKHKLAYSPPDNKYTHEYLTFKPRSPLKPGLFESAHHSQNTAFRTSQPFSPPGTALEGVKRPSDNTDFMRHTMNSKVARRLGNLNWQDPLENKPSKSDDFLRQTMSYKSSTRYTLKDQPSRQTHFLSEHSESSLHYHRLNNGDSISSAKSTNHLLDPSRNYHEYEKLSEKIDRNKKLIQELRKTAKNDKAHHKDKDHHLQDKDLLKNVTHNKAPAYIELDQPNQQTQTDAFRKAKKDCPAFLTPQLNKDLRTSPFKSSPDIENPKSAEKQSPGAPPGLSQTSISSPSPSPTDPTSPNPKKKFSPFASKDKPKHHVSCQLQDFECGKKLGEGKFGQVSLVRHKRDGGVFALKKIPKAMIKSHMMVDQLSLEIRIQSCLNHRNILGMYGCFDDKTHLYIVLEYMDGGTLYEQLKKTSKLSEPQTAAIIKQMAEAIDYLHDMGIAHRDLKPQNIVVSNSVYKLCDFGWAAICDERRKTYCGTFDYVAPQILEGVDYDMTVDLWCLGVMTFELMTGKAPFYHISRKETMKKILNVETENIVFPETMSEEAKDFIQKLVRKNPNERIKASQALRHPFLKKAQEQ